MNTLKSLLNPISQLSFDLRGSDRLKAYNAARVLYNATGLELSWQSLPHGQLLNVIANQLGYHSMYGKTPWGLYTQQIAEIAARIDRAYQILNPNSLEWLKNEDPSSIRWHMYLKRNEVDFKNRKELLRKYLEVRHIEFNRCKLNGLSFIGASFDLLFTVDDLAAPVDLYEIINARNEITFFKSSLGWFYLYDSKLLYCSFLNNCFRNAIFHNIDFRYNVLSSKEKNGDIMGADFSFSDCQYSVFSYCYAREARFYKCNIDHALFDYTNLVGALFLNSSLKKACFVGANIQNVSFKGSNLQGADFTGAYISNADCRGADLRRVKGLDISLIRIDEATLL